jgi:type II secretory pathway component GspD/PulD (secretin)
VKFIAIFLIALSLGSCRQESSAHKSGAQPDQPTVDQSSKIAKKVDPDLVIVGAEESVNETDISVLRAAQLYENYSGKRVIMTNEIADRGISFSMRGPLTNAEAARFLQLTLLAEGLAILPLPDEVDVVRLIPSGPITSFGGVIREFLTEESQLPEDDQLVVFLMRFKHLKPEDGLKAIQAELGQLSDSGVIATVPNASSLLITEKASLIRQMIKIQKKIDLPADGKSPLE